MLAAVVFAAPGLKAGRPWRPSISVPATERLGRRQVRLDAKKMKQFHEIYGHGERLLARGRYREAAQALKKAIEIYPDHLGARIAHVRSLLAIGYLSWNPELIHAAIEDIRHAGQLAPHNRQVRVLARLLDSLTVRMQVYRRHKKRSAVPDHAGH